MLEVDPSQHAAQPSGSAPSATVLEVEDLHTHLTLRTGTVRAVNGFSCTLRRGETLGVVGESGCGKSMMALSILRLVPDPPGKVVDGSVRFQDRELLALSDAEMRQIRGRDISMIFQEPMTSLNPVMTIGRQISEAIMLHENLARCDALDKTVEVLRLVRIPDAESHIDDYPHRLSGGMRQRVMIAMALACNPRILLADEPTTALDVTIQAQILSLMNELQERLGTAIILITHNMGVIAERADRVVVMYAGRNVEEAPVDELFASPQHPYTAGLLGSIPHLDRSASATVRQRLTEIKGTVPALSNLPPGCAFAPRCSYATEICHRVSPRFEQKQPGHFAACWHSDRLGATA